PGPPPEPSTRPARAGSGNDSATAAATRQTATLTAPASRKPPTTSSGVASTTAAESPSSRAVPARPISRGESAAWPTAVSPSYTTACAVPEVSEPPTPQRTKPAANAGYDGRNVHSPNPRPRTTWPRASNRRRDTRSAQAPDGTSNAIAVPDHTTNNPEICPADSPWAA